MLIQKLLDIITIVNTSRELSLWRRVRCSVTDLHVNIIVHDVTTVTGEEIKVREDELITQSYPAGKW